MEERPRHIGLEFKIVNNMIRRYMEKRVINGEDERLTGMQMRVIDYLGNHAPAEVYQRDLEQTFDVRGATITGILQVMEKNGLIVRTAAKGDARCKKLEMTQKAARQHEQTRRDIEQIEAMLARNITPEDIDAFFRVSDQIRKNILEEEQRADG